MRIHEWIYLFCGSQGYLSRIVSGAHHSTRVAEKLLSVAPLQRTIIDIPYCCCHRNQRVVCTGIYFYTSYLTRKHKSRAYKRNCCLTSWTSLWRYDVIPRNLFPFRTSRFSPLLSTVFIWPNFCAQFHALVVMKVAFLAHTRVNTESINFHT